MGIAEDSRGARRLKHRLEHAVVRRLLRSFAARPLDEAIERGARLGRIWHALDRRHRRLAAANIRLGLGHDAASASRVACASFESIGRTLAEFALAAERPDELLARVDFEDGPRLRQVLAAGRGLLLVSGHCGNWELLGARVGREIPLTSIARPLANPLVDQTVTDLRRAAGIRTVASDDAAREVLRTLRRGEAVAVLLDQSASRGERVFVNFLGRPAATNFGLALLALKSGAPVLPGFSARGADGRHRVWIGEPIAPADSADRGTRLGVTTARYTAAIEAWVRRHPDQWFWVHDRWKRTPGPDDPVFAP
ncbi:MAG TPA: lysophospholipid acyltransferase family protein [bacterium]